MSDLHVMPIADMREHIQGRACWCGPRVELSEDDSALVVHHSLDGREHFEPEGDTGKETIQ